MGINQLKTIDNILGIASLTAVIASFFYHPLIYEASILCLLWIGFDAYVALKTSITDFLIDLLFIASILVATFLAPNHNITALLTPLIPNTLPIPKQLLAKTLGISAISPLMVLKILDVINSLQEDVVVL